MKDVQLERAGASHSLVDATIIIAFANDLDAQRLEKLRSLPEHFKESFTKSSANQSLNVSVSEGKTESSTEFSGWTLDQISTSSDLLDWQLVVDQNRIMIKCLEYPGWGSFRDSSALWISQLSEFLDLANWPVQEIGVMFTDRFYWSINDKSYQLGKFFNEHSRFLPESIKQSTPLWHLFQGWIEEADGREYIQNLNLSTQWEEKKPHKTEILNVIRCVKSANSELSGLNGDTAKAIMEKAHHDNKKTLNDLLTPETLEFIGLNS